MRVIGISTGYTPGVYIIWEVPHENITGYEVYRNEQMIASSLLESEEERAEFVQPTVFDHDHQTNLFKKDSIFKLMYVDEDVHRHQFYEYKVVAKRIVDGVVMEEITSNDVHITAN